MPESVLGLTRKGRRKLMSQIIRAAMPSASDADCEHVLWGRTPYPVGSVTARSLYLAASRYRRACANGIRLCDFCDNVAVGDEWACRHCLAAMNRVEK